jgi:hypothetical protein
MAAAQIHFEGRLLESEPSDPKSFAANRNDR